MISDFYYQLHLHSILTIHVSTAPVSPHLKNLFMVSILNSSKQQKGCRPQIDKYTKSKITIGIRFLVGFYPTEDTHCLTVLQHEYKHPRCSLNQNSQNPLFSMAKSRYPGVEGPVIFLDSLIYSYPKEVLFLVSFLKYLFSIDTA